jgi:hypothetical protein
MFVETFAINQFLRNHNQLTAFCVLTHNPPLPSLDGHYA